jgi:hypothetical protein
VRQQDTKDTFSPPKTSLAVMWYFFARKMTANLLLMNGNGMIKREKGLLFRRLGCKIIWDAGNMCVSVCACDAVRCMMMNGRVGGHACAEVLLIVCPFVPPPSDSWIRLKGLIARRSVRLRESEQEEGDSLPDTPFALVILLLCL